MSSSIEGPDLVARAEEAAEFLRNARGGEIPRVAAVFGSGLNELVGRFEDRKIIPYAEIPNFPVTTVVGHAGNLVFGSVEGVGAILLQGRFHYYEGHDLTAVTFPIRVLQRLGVRSLILTAATGGIHPDLRPGNLVCLSDHINLMGVNPLRGPDDPRLGTRFPDLTEPYSKRLADIAREEAARIGVHLPPGVYACLPGPSFETSAEINMLRVLGADVVGMSTVPEAIVARQAGMEVLGLALVSNAAAGVLGTPIRHEDVIEAGRAAAPILGELIRRVVLRVGAEPTRESLSPARLEPVD